MSKKSPDGNLLSQAAVVTLLRKAFARGVIATPEQEAELLKELSGPDWEAFLNSRNIRDVLDAEIDSTKSGQTFRMSLD